MTTRSGGRRRDGRRYYPRRKVCSFCVDKIEHIDYKDGQRLRRYVSDWAKIESRRKTGTCAPHQRMLATAIKRARYVGLLPYTGGHSQMDLTFRDGPRADRFRRDRERREAEQQARAAQRREEEEAAQSAPTETASAEAPEASTDAAPIEASETPAETASGEVSEVPTNAATAEAPEAPTDAAPDEASETPNEAAPVADAPPAAEPAAESETAAKA